MNNKLSVSLLALNNINHIDEFLLVLRKENIKYIELPISKITKNYDYKGKDLINFKKKLKENLIKVSSVQAIFYGKNNLNIFNISHHKDIIKHLKKVFLIAKSIGAKNIIFGSPKNRFIKKKIKIKTENIAINFFKKIGKLCKKNNLFFCIEPNSKFYNCNFINTIKEAIILIKKINSKHILINADTGNINLEKENLSNLTLNKNHFRNFQISEKNLIPISRGSTPHVKILKNFDTTKRHISLEMLNVDIKNLKKEVIKFKNMIKKLK